RISTFKRQYGWDRTHLDDIDGAGIWTGHGVLAHNLVKISALGELTPQPTKISNGSAQPAHSAPDADRTATSILVSGGREPPPPALAEPYVTVARHTAPTDRRRVNRD